MYSPGLDGKPGPTQGDHKDRPYGSSVMAMDMINV